MPNSAPLSSPGLGQEDHIPIQRDFQADVVQHHLQAGNPRALVVNRAPPIDKAIAHQAAERIDRPLVPLHANYVNVAHHQQRLFRSVTFEAGINRVPRPGADSKISEVNLPSRA